MVRNVSTGFGHVEQMSKEQINKRKHKLDVKCSRHRGRRYTRRWDEVKKTYKADVQQWREFVNGTND